MKFPNILTIDGYCDLLTANGCEVLAAEDTGRFAPYVDLYLNMLNMQLTYDALRIIGFDPALMEALAGRDELHAAAGPRRQDRPGTVRRPQEVMRWDSATKAKTSRSTRPIHVIRHSRRTGQRLSGSSAKPWQLSSMRAAMPNGETATRPLAWFGRMISNCLQYAAAAKAAGRPVVGILCEYTPRELIMAAGGVPVCLCGGSAKTIPAAEEHLPANLCPLIKSTYGYHVQRSNPFLEMADLVVGETTCDGKKKMYELMAESRPMYVLELPQKPDDADALDHWVRELRKLKTRLEERFQRHDHRRASSGRRSGVMNRERALRRELAALMKADRPPLTGRQLLDFKSSISGIMPIRSTLEQYGAGSRRNLATASDPRAAQTSAGRTTCDGQSAC